MTKRDALRMARAWVDALEREAPDDDVVMLAGFCGADGEGIGMFAGLSSEILELAKGLVDELTGRTQGEIIPVPEEN